MKYNRENCPTLLGCIYEGTNLIYCCSECEYNKMNKIPFHIDEIRAQYIAQEISYIAYEVKDQDDKLYILNLNLEEFKNKQFIRDFNVIFDQTLWKPDDKTSYENIMRICFKPSANMNYYILQYDFREDFYNFVSMVTSEGIKKLDLFSQFRKGENKMKDILHTDCIHSGSEKTIYSDGTIISKEIECKYYKQKIESCSCCSKYEKRDKDKKLKQVVKEIPSKEVYVTYKWLREQNACQEAVDTFVEEFGKEAKYDDIINKIKIYQKRYPEYDYYSWLAWLGKRTEKLFTKDDVEYISVDKIDFEDKIYFGITKKKIYKIVSRIFSTRESNKYEIISLDDNENFRIPEESLFCNYYFIYEFDSFDDFVKNYNRLKEIQKEIK